MEDILGVALPQLLERAFLNGVIIIAGVEYRPESSTLAAALQSALRQVAGNIFTEFIDVRVERDEDCAKILRWRPGASLTSAYYQLDLIGASGVNTSCQAVSLLRSELLRRQQTGLERTGSALVEHFRKKPYGWGHQLVRLIAACLFKNGDISIELVNRELNDVNDPPGQRNICRLTPVQAGPAEGFALRRLAPGQGAFGRVCRQRSQQYL